MHVCIVAEHASKCFGGEAIIPYHYFRILRDRGVDAWLIVHMRTGIELESLFPNDLDRLRFVEEMSTFLPRRISESTFGLANQFLTQLS